MSKRVTKEELLAKANKPSEDAMKLHAFYRGKMQTLPRCHIRSFADFASYYSPGVAAPCRAIQADESRMNEFTGRWNTIAVVTDGTRVLGLGDIGPKAGYPVMEGKCMLFKHLGGVDAVPICLGTKDPDQIIQAVKWLQPSFAAINLEDISSPKCFRILDQLRAEAEIPIFHDDQQGTATVILSGLINALRIVGKRVENARVVLNGAGAANVACARLMFAMGINPKTTVVVDSKGILHPGRKDIELEKALYVHKWQFCLMTNAERRTGTLADALKGADVLVSLAKSGPDVITQREISGMAKDAICFVCANPIPEIWPWEAKEAGARIVATGRSDFPNQVNNSTVFPALFRGVLDVQAKTITDEMCIAAAVALADYAVEQGISDEYISPTMDQPEAFIREAVAVGMKAQEQGVATKPATREQLREMAKTMITGARDAHDALVKAGCILPAST
ncbi:MAG: NADP-dependent malic enzyme [Dehalococcoidia bacterium]|jgi:malate dehydrogenase (oxaloacetate-decarboxylating)|nr:NADP-dependent malic enzyme [Dehalococcoidia bacterium]